MFKVMVNKRGTDFLVSSGFQTEQDAQDYIDKIIYANWVFEVPPTYKIVKEDE